MKKTLCVLMVLSIALLGSVQAARAQDASKVSKAPSEAVTPQNIGNTICPVTGETIDDKTKATYEYRGKIYNFCCAMCIEDFKKDPEKYIKKINEIQTQSLNATNIDEKASNR